MKDKELVSDGGKMFKPNEKDFLISIVIPIYNAEKYLEECLNSIKNQTYKNFEVIMVNDGSKDDSETICMNFLRSDSRFRYLKKENGGVSSARNVGLDNVEGDYITFIDADDWVDENHLEILIDGIIKNNCEVAISSYMRFINTRETYLINIYSNQEKYLLNYGKMNREKFLTELPKLISINNSFNCAVSKLFSRRLVEDIRFDSNIIYAEDLDFYFKLYLKANNFIFINAETYIYRQHDESTTSGFSQIHAEQELSVFKKMYETALILGIPTVNYVRKLQTLIDFRNDFLENKELLAEYKQFLSDAREIQTYPQKLISIIVPIYNVYPYLQLCLESIENQTYPHFEVLLINDGSRDDSKDICQEFINKDKRFRYFEQENLGISAARNTGIVHSNGEFITFIDGDDFIDPNYLEELYHAALKNDSEIVVASYKEFNEEDNNYYIHVFDYKEEHFKQNELIAKRGIEFETSWGILFHQRLFEHIQFPVGKSIGDCFTNYKLFMESCKASYIHKDFYIHRIRKGSLSTRYTEKYFTDVFEALLERVATLALLGIDISEEKSSLIDRLQLQYKQMQEAGLQETEIFRRYKEFFCLLG